MGLASVVVVKETASGQPANASYCASTREKYGLTMPVLYDPKGEFGAAYQDSNALNIVLDADLTITFKKKYASEAEVTGAIEEALED